MIQPIRILIVEGEMIIAANISLQLTEMGYEISGIIPRGEDALSYIKITLPDIVVIDFQLKGEWDGIETAQKMQKFHNNIAIIYLIANENEAKYTRAKSIHPFAFIKKPIRKTDLQQSIELIINRLKCNITIPSNGSKTENSTFVLKECLFVRHQETMVKVDIKAIRYVEADRNYCRIFSTEREYLLVTTLKDMDIKLPHKHFLRIHRSYIINLSRIDEIAGTHVVISKKAIPLAKGMRAVLLKRLQTI